MMGFGAILGLAAIAGAVAYALSDNDTQQRSPRRAPPGSPESSPGAALPTPPAPKPPGPWDDIPEGTSPDAARALLALNQAQGCDAPARDVADLQRQAGLEQTGYFDPMTCAVVYYHTNTLPAVCAPPVDATTQAVLDAASAAWGAWTP